METIDDENFASFFQDAPYIQFECDTEDCPPPLFSLPPPPRPPWLEDPETCQESSAEESCDNILIIDSQVHLKETFHNLIIIAVCAAILVILLVFLVACIWRARRGSGCQCGDNKSDSNKEGMELSERDTREVYDNPNYSHIMIGGQPFFILPSGELSEHVPVPASGETLTPRNVPEINSSQHHIYEGGSSTYRSTSDYDTDSSTYRPDSDRSQCQPIYEEIDKEGEMQGVTEAVMHSHQRLGRAEHHWSHLSPRRQVVRANTSIYYYSDTIRCKKTERELAESDSGISSESTPSHIQHGNSEALSVSQVNSNENHLNLVQTQVLLFKLKKGKKDKIAKL